MFTNIKKVGIEYPSEYNKAILDKWVNNFDPVFKYLTTTLCEIFRTDAKTGIRCSKYIDKYEHLFHIDMEAGIYLDSSAGDDYILAIRSNNLYFSLKTTYTYKLHKNMTHTVHYVFDLKDIAPIVEYATIESKSLPILFTDYLLSKYDNPEDAILRFTSDDIIIPCVVDLRYTGVTNLYNLYQQIVNEENNVKNNGNDTNELSKLIRLHDVHCLGGASKTISNTTEIIVSDMVSLCREEIDDIEKRKENSDRSKKETEACMRLIRQEASTW